jgi:hypothetical protein
MTNKDAATSGRFPWFQPAAGLAAAGFSPVSAIAAMQKAWIESAATAMRAFQPMAMPPQAGWAGGASEGASPHHALKSIQETGAAMLNANMKAFEVFFGPFAGAPEAMGGKPLSQATAAKTAGKAANETLESWEKAQETSGKAWTMLQRRLAESVKEWNATASAWSQESGPPAAMKDSFQRLASDSEGLFGAVQKSNANALDLMQKQFSTVAEEMKKLFPNQAHGKLENAAKAYERAATAISDALAGANKEAMEALQAWSSECTEGARKMEPKAA